MTRFLIDCDGVMAQFATTYLDVLEAQTGRKHALDDVTTWEFKDTVSSADEDARVWAYIRNNPGTVLGIDPEPGTRTALARLRRCGEVVCVTKPQWGTSWAAERYDWLAGLGFTPNEIVFTGKKSLVKGDVLVEDNPVYLQEWLDAWPQGGGVLIARPWNRGHEFSAERIYVYNSLYEFASRVYTYGCP